MDYVVYTRSGSARFCWILRPPLDSGAVRPFRQERSIVSKTKASVWDDGRIGIQTGILFRYDCEYVQSVQGRKVLVKF